MKMQQLKRKQANIRLNMRPSNDELRPEIHLYLAGSSVECWEHRRLNGRNKRRFLGQMEKKNSHQDQGR